jgi:hypothetical protein
MWYLQGKEPYPEWRMGTSVCTSYSDTADPIPGLLQVANYIIQTLYFSKHRLASKHTLTVVHKIFILA